MKEFMFLFRGGVAPDAADQYKAYMQRWGAWIQELIKKEKFVSGKRLNNEGGRFLRKHGKVITDGPFIESKEMIGGYFIIKAVSLAEAAEISKDCPLFESGGIVEVRPIQNTDV